MDEQKPAVDIVEAGSGPTFVLVHSSVAGARQWRRLMSDLEDRFHLIAFNLFGYGRTPLWHGRSSQTLADQAGLIEAALPDTHGSLSLVGHSFGGSVAMKAASRLGKRVDKLVLLEPNPFYLLDQHGRGEAFAESMGLRDWIKQKGASGDLGGGGRALCRLLGWRRNLGRHARRAPGNLHRGTEAQLP